MKCYVCGTAGKPIGLWFSSPSGNVWSRFKCGNPNCRFEYINNEGETGSAKPTWMVPAKELNNG